MWHQSVNCNFMKPRQYMTQARGGASADPDPDPDPDPRACVMYCRERTSTRETVEMKMWNKIFIFVFFAQKVFSWLHKITVDRLMSHGLLCRSSWYFSGPWSCEDPCCLWEGQRALRFKLKYLNLCSEDERRSYGFGTTWGWVINDRIFIFLWTIPREWKSILLI